jgi:energy-coupling factor transporter ATP-binding protein EcfA2
MMKIIGQNVDDDIDSIIGAIPEIAMNAFMKKVSKWAESFGDVDYKAIYDHLQKTDARSAFLSAGSVPEFKLYGKGPRELLVKVLTYAMLGDGQPITLIGPPGSGKSQLVEALGAVYMRLIKDAFSKFGIPEYVLEYAKLYEVQMNPNISKSALFQGRDLESTKEDGMKIPMRLNSGGVALVFGGVLFLDELNHAPSDIIAYLNQFLEPQTAVVSFRGLNIRRSPVSIIITSLNPKGKGAGYNITSKDLPQTYTDRSWASVFVPRSSYEDECDIVTSLLKHDLSITPDDVIVRYSVSLSRKFLSKELQTSLRRSFDLAKTLHSFVGNETKPFPDAIKAISAGLGMKSEDVLRRYYALVHRKEIYHPDKVVPFDETETENETMAGTSVEKASTDKATERIVRFVGSNMAAVLETVRDVLQVFLLPEDKRSSLSDLLP